MRILVTNDDGVHSEGILALRKALDPLGDVFVVAPERPRSATGHAITLHKPLRLSRARMADGHHAWASNGTPADCATLGIVEVMGNQVDLVVSGINHGPNLGWDVHYSGTVSAAFEAVMIGHPAIAVSVSSWDEAIDWTAAAQFTAKLAEWVGDHPLPPFTLLNVNAPNVPAAEIAGIEVTRLGPRQYVDRIEKRADPSGREYYWLGGALKGREFQSGTDAHAIGANKISVTPLALDMTDTTLLRDIQAVAGL